MKNFPQIKVVPVKQSSIANTNITSPQEPTQAEELANTFDMKEASDTGRGIMLPIVVLEFP